MQPDRHGLPLSSLRAGATARIVHVEDEPDAVYAQSCDWTPEEAEGFIKLIGKSSTMAAKIRGRR